MLSKLLRSFVGGDQNSQASSSRKRKAREFDDDDDVIVTNTKKCKPNDANVGWHLGGFAEWIVRSKRSFQDTYNIRNIKSHVGPINLLGRFSPFAKKKEVSYNDNNPGQEFSARQDFMNQGDMSQNRASGHPYQKAPPPPPQPPPPSGPSSSTTVPSHTEPLCSSGAVAPPPLLPTSPPQPRPPPKTGYVDLPYPFVFPTDVIWTQDGQFKMPAPKLAGDPGLRQRHIRPPFRLVQRSPMPGSGHPSMSTPPTMSTPGGLPYPGLNPGPSPSPGPPHLHTPSSSAGPYQPLYDKMYRQNSNRSTSSTNITDTLYRSQLAAKESIRLDEKSRYEQLLQQFTSLPLSNQDKTRPRRHTPTARSRDETVLGTSISMSQSSIRRSTSRNSKPEVIEVNAHSSAVPSPITDYSRPLSSRLHDDPPTAAPPHVTSTPANCVRPKLLNHGPKQNGSSPSQVDRLSVDSGQSSRSSEVIILDSPPALSPKSFVVEDFERSLRDLKHNEEWLHNFKQSHAEQARRRKYHIQEEEVKREIYNEECDERDRVLENELRRRLKLGRKTPAVEAYEYVETSSESEEEEEEEDEFPELSEEQEDQVDAALRSRPPQEILSDGFRLQVRRADMVTLSGLNWLNDEVVNFYFELIRERGKLDNFPSVHVFNTFFYPKVKNQGQQGVRRWTKSVDIFSFDYIAIPIHLGMHWCLAIVDFGNKAIRYFDSMGGNNMECLNLLKKYLADEHKQKKGAPYDLSEWSLENVKGIPQQMNGSDCGVFTCKYADYICRGRQITFSQANMPYFRRRMVYEILNKELL